MASETTPTHRLALLTGEAAVERLHAARVIVFGIGGVGSWAVEGLVRSGVRDIALVDGDVICLSNVNRQLQATVGNIGRPKVDELRRRLESIDPAVQVATRQAVYTPDNADDFPLDRYDYVLDCIHTVAAKTELLARAAASPAKVFASMGAARKLDPTRARTASIWETRGCPLARIIRRNLRERGVQDDFQAVYSPEALALPPETDRDAATGKIVNGSAVHVTAVFGMILAGLVVRDAMDDGRA